MIISAKSTVGPTVTIGEGEYELINWPKKVNISSRWTRDEDGNGIQAINDEEERRKMRTWISENPRLIPVESYVAGYKTEREKFWEAVRCYHIANADYGEDI